MNSYECEHAVDETACHLIELLFLDDDDESQSKVKHGPLKNARAVFFLKSQTLTRLANSITLVPSLINNHRTAVLLIYISGETIQKSKSSTTNY